MKLAFHILLCVLAILASTRESQSDDKKPQEVKGWGIVTDPDGDCTVKEEKGKLTITVPGTYHNLNPALGSNAPRVLQPVEGDFTATVKVTCALQPGEEASKPRRTPFNGTGLFVWHNDKNCLRLERNVWWRADLKRHICYPPLLEYYKEGNYQNTDPPSTYAENFFKGPSTYLRLTRKGEKVVTAYSHDGKSWTDLKEIIVDLPRKVHVGVAAVNTSKKAFTAEFEDLKITAGN